MTRGGRVSGVLLSSNGSRIIVTTKVDGINGGRGVGKVYQDEDQAPFGRTWYYGGAEGLQVRWVGWLLSYIFCFFVRGLGGSALSLWYGSTKSFHTPFICLSSPIYLSTPLYAYPPPMPWNYLYHCYPCTNRTLLVTCQERGGWDLASMVGPSE